MVFNLFAVEIMIDSSLSKDKRNFIKYTLLGMKEDVYKDNKTSLIWQNSNVKSMDWNSAKKYCDKLDMNTFRDWYLPSLRELKSVRYNRALKGLDYKAPYYWSSNINSHNIDYARNIHISDGGESMAKKSKNGYARCVRKSQ